MAPQTPTDILQPRLPHVGSDLYVQDPLLKSLTSPEMPTGIKHRIIPALDQLGHYRGVQEPRRRTAITTTTAVITAYTTNGARQPRL